MWSIQYSGSRSSGGSRVKGLRGANNSVTPNTQYDFIADEVVLRNPVDGSEYAQGTTGTITCNVSTAGPAANGRDQAGAFSASSWIHFYFIWGTGVSLATLASAVAPPTGPTLPTGYTHWAYATALRFTGGSVFLKYYVRGRRTSYQDGGTDAVVLTGSSSTAEETVDISAFIPPNALEVEMANELTVTSAATGLAYTALRLVAGINSYFVEMPIAVAAVQTVMGAILCLPNVGQSFIFRWATAYTSRACSIWVYSYIMPNGDS